MDDAQLLAASFEKLGVQGVGIGSNGARAAAGGGGIKAAWPEQRDADPFMLKNVPIAARSLAEFELGRVVGSGSFGRVRLARHAATGLAAAIKTLAKAAVLANGHVRHVLNERDLLRRVDHPAFVRLLGSFADATCLHLVLEFVPGGELFTFLRRQGSALSEAHAVFYVAQLVLAFEHLHARDIVYRDLKPENLLLDAQGYLKVTDFGFAKVVASRTYTLCGTPEYLAPEVITNRGHGKAVDWWTLGVLTYELLAGRPPWCDAHDQANTYKLILGGELALPAGWSPLAKDFVGRLLQRDLTMRLGNLAGGAADVKTHPWLLASGVDWAALATRAAPAPYVPAAPAPGGDGASNFDDYSDLGPIEHEFVLTREQQAEFAEF